jgi:hypothetical protein
VLVGDYRRDGGASGVTISSNMGVENVGADWTILVSCWRAEGSENMG